MPAYQSDNLNLKVSTPLGDDVLLLHHMEGTEELSNLFMFTLTCHSALSHIEAEDLVGREIGFSVKRQSGSWRHFHGLAVSFFPMDDGSGQSLYRVRVAPWLWCLTLTSDCRIYQQKDVKEIVTDVFQRHGFGDYDMSGLSGTYQKREYCVQYNESAFNFVSRLMEEEGIFYWFKHEKSRHVLMLGDSTSAYQTADDGSVAFRKDPQGGGGDDLVTSWERECFLATGYYASRDYDYENPDRTLEGKSGSAGKLEKMDRLEAYFYPGRRIEAEELSLSLERRRDSAESATVVVTGSSVCQSFSPGLRFSLDNHPDASEAGKSYVLTRVSHVASGSRQAGGAAGSGEEYSNIFRCVPVERVARPERRSATPSVRGVETAVVTGPGGEEIHTDGLGRIKIQFHWDREGKRDDESSCWVRVSQPVAGNGWGAFALPRVGQEVVVSFVDGDPDRPLVTGTVYNGLNKPPYELPDDKTKTVLRTRSTPGGSAGNELTFEDKSGQEEILLHGEKDLIVTVNNDSDATIDNDLRLLVCNDAESTVENNCTLSVGGDSKRTVSKSETVEVKGDESVSAKTITLEGKSKIVLKVGGSSLEMTASGVTIKSAKVEVKGDAAVSVGAPKVDVKGDAMLTLDGGVVMIG